MKLTDEDIEKFQQAWREEFGDEITSAFARQRFHEILELYPALRDHKRNGSPGSSSSRS
jgi:hypothetical protein